jgi:MoaA/NifB/PqqE/SkfB family radical SAM enzyme
MSFEEFKTIVDQFPKLKWAGLTGIGSSFLNKDFLKMIRYLKERSVIVEIIDTFNAPVNEKILRELIEIEPDILFVSIYGGSSETYNKICVGGNFDKVIENIRTFVRLKKEKGTLLPVLNFHYIVTKPNVLEITKFLEFVHSLMTEVGEVLLTPLLHSFEEVKDIEIDLTEDIVKHVEEKAKKLGITLAYNLSVPKKGRKPPITHCVEWIMPFVFATGHVIPCCAGNEANRREFQKATSLGNVFNKSFKEIWYGDEYKKFREMIRKGIVPLQCSNCPIYIPLRGK